MSGTRQWGRLCSLIVAPEKGEGLDLSQLRVHFQAVSRTTNNMPDLLEARVYNLAPQTVQKLMALPIVPPGQIVPANAPAGSGTVTAGSATGLGKQNPTISPGPPAQVVLKAGYEGNFGTIFQGQLIQVRSGRESPIDDYVDLFAADGDTTHKWGMMNTTLAAGWKAEDVAKQAVSANAKYGLTGGQFPDDTDPPQRPAPRGKVCFGTVRDVLDDIAATHRVNWWISRNNLEFVPLSAYKPGDVVKITSKSGMIGYPHQTNFGVSVTCLLNPAIGRGSRIQIDNRSVTRAPFSPTSQGDAVSINSILASNLDADGLYKVLQVSHVGDTRANEWYTEVQGITVDPTGGSGGQQVPDQAVLRLAT